MLQFILAIFLSTALLVDSKGLWSYANPKGWVRIRGNRYCGGNLQSPIDLRYDVSIFDRRLKGLYLEDQYASEPAEIVNNGHTVQLNLKNFYLLKNVAPDSEDFRVQQIHFHWGQPGDHHNGSEHLHEGKPYPLEMHMVTYSSWYSDINEAKANTRSLAVVGIFFELSEDDEPNPQLQPLVEALTHIREKDQRATVSELFNLKDLIGKERMERYYRYDGSLTTPPCYESVIWSVLIDPLKLSRHQLRAFANVHDEEAHSMKNVYRPVQKLGTRKLFRSFHSKDVEEDRQQRMQIEANRGQYFSSSIKLILIFICFLIGMK